MAISPTNSGKTYAYGLPLLSNIDTEEEGIHCLVIVPTRELSQQVEKDLQRTKTKVATLAVYGGIDRTYQIEYIKKNLSLVVIATPGRMCDLIQESIVVERLRNLKWLVLDEADQLATKVDLANQVDEILDVLDKKRLRVNLFSATSPRAAGKWKLWIGNSYADVKVNTVTLGTKKEASKMGGIEITTSDKEEECSLSGTAKSSKHVSYGLVDVARIPSNVTQILHVCAVHKKPKKLMTTLGKIRYDKMKREQSLCLVFFSRIKTLQYVSKLLKNQGVVCSELHSHLNQKERETILLNFRAGKVQTLLATDIAARGIHISHLNSVINYDFPVSLEQYIHRCGRAGRSGNKPATVYSFFTRDLRPMSKDIIMLLTETKAWIDPNLIELSEEKVKTSKRGEKRKKVESTKKEQADEMNEAHDLDRDNEKQYAFLNPNRVALKRASHISDASESEDEE
eukprot:CAMPEP_0194252272 /NCGR_PEP_ID=MMETSP0158-20130606/27185_1 /TAXON_ID=33649 /ORGANISM="Thalassionema nitzschioides, Strain L26-B" /LENGTH=454 /DNA_ID=CAMNT_0038989645 /DNA_START=355 /DNA_END=1719 /DNA_ORIENTATION=+